MTHRGQESGSAESNSFPEARGDRRREDADDELLLERGPRPDGRGLLGRLERHGQDDEFGRVRCRVGGRHTAAPVAREFGSSE